MIQHRYFLLALATLGTLSACDPKESITDEIQVEVAFTVNGQPLQLGEAQYTSEDGLTYQIDDYKMYLSNLVLVGPRDYTFAEPDSYHLVSAPSDGSPAAFTLTVPAEGIYTELRLGIGVDSAANLSLDAPGDLNPSNLMAWNWNTGYKFVLLEGQVQAADSTLPLVFHLGGTANYTELRLPFTTLNLEQDEDITLKLTVEVAELFRNPTTIAFGETNNVQGGPEGTRIAQNWRVNMVQLDSILKTTVVPNP